MPLFPSGLPTATVSTLFSSTATQTVAATVAETTIIGSGSGSLILPANYLTQGKVLRFVVRGLYSTPALNIGSIAIKLKFGSTVLNAAASASALAVSITNAGFDGEAFITCRSVGASGTVVLMGGLTYGIGNNLAPLVLAINNGVTATTIDTTVAQTLDCTVTWSNNTAGNSVSSLNCLLEGLN